jgi:hypothetical protein
MRQGTLRVIAQTTVVLALAAVGASAAQADTFIPGYTDFPNALRVADEQPAFIPGYTDFPNALRLAPAKTIPTAGLVRVAAGRSTSASGFDWADAGIGAGVTATFALLLVGASAGLRRKTRLSVSS